MYKVMDNLLNSDDQCSENKLKSDSNNKSERYLNYSSNNCFERNKKEFQIFVWQ